MLAITFVVSCVSVCGFYAYVLVHLRREQKREDAHKKHLSEHLYEMEPEPREKDAESPEDPSFLRPGIGATPNWAGEASLRRDAMLGVGLTVGGLVAVLAGIELFNSLVTRLHWN